ncbi:MAG: hypothetical protein WCG83_03060 [Candidatus Peregrinibacteria bacterium]
MHRTTLSAVVLAIASLVSVSASAFSPVTVTIRHVTDDVYCVETTSLAIVAGDPWSTIKVLPGGLLRCELKAEEITVKITEDSKVLRVHNDEDRMVIVIPQGVMVYVSRGEDAPKNATRL